MKAKLASTVTVLLAVAVLASEGLSNTFSEDAGCIAGHRIYHGHTDCLRGNWNTVASTDPDTGAWYYDVKNECSSDGTVVAHIELEDSSDESWTLSNGLFESPTDRSSKTENIYCCIDASDLCNKAQLVPEQGGIKHYTVTSTGYRWMAVDIGEHENRYQYCASYPDTIYCEKDPQRDAFVMPESIADPDHRCGVGGCTVEKCEEAFADSPAADECTDVSADLVLDRSGGDCYIFATCTDPDNTETTKTVPGYGFPYADVSDLDACTHPTWGYDLYPSSAYDCP